MSKRILSLVLFFGIFALFMGCKNDEQSTDTKSFARTFNPGDEIILDGITGTSIKLIRTQKGFKLAGSDKTVMFDIFGTY